MTKRKRYLGAFAVGFVLLLLFCAGCGAPIPGTDIAFFLMIGWVSFLFRVLPRMHVRWALAGSAVVYAILFILGSHYFLRWLHREVTRGPRPDAAPAPPEWPWKWTAQMSLLTALMFVTGLAVTGVMRQTEWLVTSKNRLYENNADRRYRPRSEKALRAMGAGLNAFAEEHGFMPDTLETLQDWSEQLMLAKLGWADHVNKYVYVNGNFTALPQASYLYFGAGIKRDGDPHAVLVVDPMENHEGEGIHVLYRDGTIEWLADNDAKEFLSRLPPAARTTKPVSERQP